MYDPQQCDRTLKKTDTLISSTLAACPASGIKHFWVSVMPENLSATQLLEAVLIYQSSKPSRLPDTVVDLANIDPDCTVFKELCHLY